MENSEHKINSFEGVDVEEKINSINRRVDAIEDLLQSDEDQKNDLSFLEGLFKFSIISGILYLLMSFIQLDAYASNWGKELRIAYVFVLVFLLPSIFNFSGKKI